MSLFECVWLDGPEYPLESKLPKGEFWLTPWEAYQLPTKRSLYRKLIRLRHDSFMRWFDCHDTSNLTLELKPYREYDVTMMRSRFDWLVETIRKFDRKLSQEINRARRERVASSKARTVYRNYRVDVTISEHELLAEPLDLAGEMVKRIYDRIKRDQLQQERYTAERIGKKKLDRNLTWA